MMRSDSDLDDISVVQEPLMEEENDDAKEEETEPPTTYESSSNEATTSKNEWRKLWRSQKNYWRERENESNTKYDARDEVEHTGTPAGGEHVDGTTQGESGAVVKHSDDAGTVNQSSDNQSDKKGWRILKLLQQRRAQEKEKAQGQSSTEEDGGHNKNDCEEEESALWRDILFTIGSLTDEESGPSTDEDVNKSLDNIEEEILRQGGIYNNNEDGSGSIPPSPWSSLRRLRDKIKDNSSSAAAEEEVNFSGNDREIESRVDERVEQEEDEEVHDSRDESGDAPRAWVSLKRIHERIKDNASAEKGENPADSGEGNHNSEDIDGASEENANGDEDLETPSPWSSLQRFRHRIKEKTVPEVELDEPAESMDDNGETLPPPEDDCDENRRSTDEIGDESNTRSWGVLKRIRKKLHADNSNESIEDQIESLAKELEKEQQKSSNENTEDDIHPKDETGEDQEKSNNAPKKGWALFKRVQDILSAERAVDDETYGFENIDEAFAFRTFHVLHSRNQELEDLVERLQRANEILKAECKLNTVKVNELTKIIESKDGSSAEDVLLHKSIENAELLMQVDELQVELDKANSSIRSLKTENKESKRLIQSMGRVLDSLHSAHVNDSSLATPSVGPSGELCIDDLEPKIERIMEDREQLVLRCNRLERENELKDEQIENLSEALDARSFHHASVEKVKGDDDSVQSEMTRSTYTGMSVSSSSIESEDNTHSRIRNLYNSVSSKMMSGKMMEVVEEDYSFFDTKSFCADNDDASSVNAIQGHGDDLESSIKKRLHASDPKYVEFLSLMGQKGMVLKSVPSGEAAECPNERPEQETTNSDEIICELVI